MRKPCHVHEWLGKQTERWSQNTRYHVASAVKRSMQWAVERGYIQSNPLAAVKVAKGEGRDFVIDRQAWREHRRSRRARQC